MTTDEMGGKKSLKHVEIPLNNFKEVAIPHHEKLLEEHRNILAQVKTDPSKLHNFRIAVRRTEAQLKSLLYELDTLRAQIQDDELDKFDMKTISLRKSIVNIHNQYKDVTKQLQMIIPVHENKIESPEHSKSPEQKQLQIGVDINELKLKDKEACLKNVENIHNDIQDLHAMYGDLNQIVNEQGELVNKVENNVEDTRENVNAGARHILSASRLKASMYPISGAVMGGVVGGPIGLLAGMKIGSVAAVCCGCLGYFGGKLLNKNQSTTEDLNQENELYQCNEINKNTQSTESRDKKDE